MLFFFMLIGCLSGAVSHQPTAIQTQTQRSKLAAMGLSNQLAYMALIAYEKAKHQTTKPYYTIVDYSLPSSQKRLWVIDMSQQKKLLFHSHVAHGQGSDVDHDGRMEQASNVHDSNATSIGIMRTAESYRGKFGLAVRLDGLEEGFNDQARGRGIVIHAADYMTPAWHDRKGLFGRSLGCPALNPKVAKKIMHTIKEGSLFFGYFPDQKWIEESQFL